MPLNIDTFSQLAKSSFFSSRDISVSGEGKKATAKLGNFLMSQGAVKNDATMAAFKSALENEYGVFGANVFDTVLGSRQEMHKSLRACDVKKVLSSLPQIRENRFVSEVNRQLDTSPRMMELPKKTTDAIRGEIAKNVLKGVDLSQCKTVADISQAAQKRIDAAIERVRDKFGSFNTSDLGPRTQLDDAATRPTDATGLRNLGKAQNLGKTFEKGETSVADLIKRGLAGEGMRVNRSETNPVILAKLKSNGVEPGFICRNDWSMDDTRGLMADISSEENMYVLDDLKANNPAFAAKCEGKTVREQIMLAGRVHPAGIAAVAEFALQDAAKAVTAGVDGHVPSGYQFKALAEGLKGHFGKEDIKRIADGTANAALLKEAKLYLFPQIRDAVMNIGPNDDYYNFSPIFKHYSERSIVKLDYNEGDKFSKGDAASAGTFMRPERILNTRKPVLGQIYRFQTRQSADDISAGAVTEALANDLTRIAGVPAQELEIVRGEYSDGHPKIMLAAKFAAGYKDMEAGMLKDGRAVPGKDAHGNPLPDPEPLGKYKAFFLLTADRDGVGKRGQNKGFINGKFFAIDPGHSLEGNGKYLKISDDFSFKDTYGRSSKPRFNNFSVFDDDTRFAKLSGLVNLRETAKSGAFEKLFNDYKAAFNPEADGLSDDEIAMRTKICAEIDKKKAEFDTQLKRLLGIGGMQLELYDDLAADGPAMQEKAINTISHLEMLTSPTTWTSKHGEVALKHLEVKPETRVPWRAYAEGDSIEFHCDKPLDASLVKMLEGMAENSGAVYTCDAAGVSRITVPKADAERFFAIFSEENVQKMTHPDEYVARMSGEDSLKVAKDYAPAEYRPVQPAGVPPLAENQLPAHIDLIDHEGQMVSYPKIHYKHFAGAEGADAPRTVEQLQAFLQARLRRGGEILDAVLSGKLHRFEPSDENIVSVTHALHAAALRKGQYMYRGAFSVRDPDGYLARWLDMSDKIYPRASTHAEPYHSMIVDGHRNEARGFDMTDGHRGFLNGMRTMHYFTIPDTDHLKNDGGSGPKRRLYLKCETYGVFVNKISSENAKASLTPDMQKRGYKFGDLLESIAHGASLINSRWTPKEAPGIQKENLLTVQKMAIDKAVKNLEDAGMKPLADKLVSRGVKTGAGIRQLLDNIAEMYDFMPGSAQNRAVAGQILDELIGDIAQIGENLPGDVQKRMGNEIMID